MARAKVEIKIGDRYVKAGDRHQNVWVVVKTWTHVDGIVHVRLAKQVRASDLITVSALALEDGEFFRSVARQSDSAA